MNVCKVSYNCPSNDHYYHLITIIQGHSTHWYANLAVLTQFNALRWRQYLLSGHLKMHFGLITRRNNVNKFNSVFREYCSIFYTQLTLYAIHRGIQTNRNRLKGLLTYFQVSLQYKRTVSNEETQRNKHFSSQ